MKSGVYVSSIPETLKEGQVQQTQNEDADLKQGYNRAKFERTCFNGVQEKANMKVFSNEEKCQLSPLNISISLQNRKGDIFKMYLMYFTNLQSFKLIE